MTEMAETTIDLPGNFRIAEVLAFHGRDRDQIAEIVTADGFRKGLLWEGAPACLSVRIADGRAACGLEIDGPAPGGTEERLASLARRMLGLSQPVDRFEEDYRDHPDVGRMIAQNPGLRLPVAASPFEALSWAITGQQISVAAAVSIRRKLILAAGIRHSGGLLCYPDARTVLGLGEDRLRQAGFSRSKAGTLLEVGRRQLSGELPLDAWLDGAEEEGAADRLLATPGVGPWTVSYACLRGYGWLDGSLHGDVAVRRSLQALLGLVEKPDARTTERWLAGFRPWRALVGAHLWAFRSAQAY